MQRLTYRTDLPFPLANGTHFTVAHTENGFDIYTGTVVSKLAEYEDILYAPDGTERITLDRLRELVEADAEGRVGISPVKVGDRIYTNSMYKDRSIVECEVTCNRMTFWISGGNDEPWCGEFEEEEIGETIFLTRAEAEQALKQEGERE